MSQLKYERVNVESLASRLRQAVGGKSRKEVAAAAKVDPSRVSRFLNGEFKIMTPALKRVCAALRISVEEFLLRAPPSELPADILTSLRRIVGRDPVRVAAAARLIRSLEVLTRGNGRRMLEM
ncbi:MAG: helix-turn-helix transcriptional regulator [Bryobacterales bacterium]|nr:helix-turn-helix transcriptional regulator [Bryobacterales bacterium]